MDHRFLYLNWKPFTPYYPTYNPIRKSSVGPARQKWTTTLDCTLRKRSEAWALSDAERGFGMALYFEYFLGVS